MTPLKLTFRKTLKELRQHFYKTCHQIRKSLSLFNSFFKKAEKKIISISGMEYDPVFPSFEWLLVQISKIYKAAAAIRLRLYQSGFLKSRVLPCFVISIGNITAGGSGKTPMTIYLAQLLIKKGLNPVVISRGYKGRLKQGSAIVGDGSLVFMDPDTAGDEPFMMAQRRLFPVVAGKDRYKAGMLAVKLFNPDVIILDDGFQHLKLKKDVNILLFNHEKPLGNGKILPAGRLRGTLAMSKNRIQAIIFTRTPAKNQADKSIRYKGLENIIDFYGKVPYFKSFHTSFLAKLVPCSKESKTWLSKKNSADSDLDMLKGANAVLVSGIADNSSFAADMKSLGCRILDHLEFDDHFRYTSGDIQMIQKKINTIKPDIVITTEKDWVKIKDKVKLSFDMAVIGINMTFQNADEFESFIKLIVRQ